MKRNNIKQGFLSLAAACLAFTACTGDFERFNTDPNSAQEVDLKMFITTMQMDAVYSCSGSDPYAPGIGAVHNGKNARSHCRHASIWKFCKRA